MNADRTDPSDPSESEKKTFLPDIAGLYCLIIFVFFVLFSGEKMLKDHDTLMHIKAGQVMIEQGEVLRQDIFSHTAPGVPWIAHEWLAEVIMAGLHQLAGLPGVVVFYCLLAALSFWLLFRLAAGVAGEWPAFLAVALALILAASHLLARPHIFTWLFGVLSFFILLRGRVWHLYALPVIMASWANVHGAFAVGLLLQGIFLAGFLLDRWPGRSMTAWLTLLAEKKHALVVLVLSVAAVGINPFGPALYLFPFQVATPLFLANINEWMGTNFQSQWLARFYLFFLFFLLLLHRERIGWADRLLLLFWVNGALAHARHLSLMAIFLVPLQASLLAPVLAGLRQSLPCLPTRLGTGTDLRLSAWSGPILTLLGALALVTMTAIGPASWRTAMEKRLPLPERFSRGAITFLQEQRPAGNMFNEYILGGFLIYELADPRVFIDGRADMYGEKIFADYLAISRLRKDIDVLLEEYDIAWVIYSRDAALLRYLRATGRWDTAYEDETTVILVRRAAPSAARRGECKVKSAELGIGPIRRMCSNRTHADIGHSAVFSLLLAEG